MAIMDLPSDVVEDILLRLPVKSLLRLKAVCKRWYNLISSPRFVKNHLRRPQTQARTRLCLICYEKYGNGGNKNAVGYIRSTTEFNDNGELLDLDRLDDIKGPLNLAYKQLFLDTCDGLFCFVDKFHDIVLWNPSTRQHNKLPPNPKLPNVDFFTYLWEDAPGGKELQSYFGFGYDSCSDDYKIVSVLIPNYESNMSVNVFSLKSFAWRSIIVHEKNRALTEIRILEEKALVFHGAVHWLALNSNNRAVILAFDFEKEKFKEMKVPGSGAPCAGLKVIEERLCLYGQAKDHQIKKWVMEKYGDESSWTQLPSPHSYVVINQLKKEWPSYFHLRDFLNNKHLLLVGYWTVVLWDDKENTQRNIMTSQKLMGSLVRFSTETLVSPYNYYLGYEC